MRILLDNCVDKRFGSFLPDHEAVHVLDRGWANLSNGSLLKTAEEAGFDILLTVDKNMRYQQNLSNRKISLVTLLSRGIDLESLRLLLEPLQKRLSQDVEPGSSIVVSD